MSMGGIRFGIRITHVPTQAEVITTSTCVKSLRNGKALLMPFLKSKVYSIKNKLATSSEVETVYNLPDGVQYPENLEEYKE